MATSDSGFFRSRRNITGMVLAVLVIVMHLIVGLGSFWPIVALAAWGAGVALTPAPAKELSSTGTAAVTAPELRHRLDEVAAQARAGRSLPREVTEQLRELQTSLHQVLRDWDDLDRVPERQVMVRAMINRYLPDLFHHYDQVPNDRDPRAVADVVESLRIMREESEDLRKAILDDNVRQLEDHTRHLRLQFGRLEAYDRDLERGGEPGAGYDGHP